MGGEAITGLKLNAFSELRRGWHEERGNTASPFPPAWVHLGHCSG